MNIAGKQMNYRILVGVGNPCELDLEVLSFMKYPLMLFVVFIHLNTSSAHCMDIASLTTSVGKALYYVLNIHIPPTF